MAFITGIDRNQKIMFPEYVEDYVEEDNPIRVIDEYVETLNFIEMGFTKTTEIRPGAPGYHPSILMKLYLYGYANGIRSTRKLESEANRNIEVMWLLRRLKPDFKTIADFRKENRNNLVKVFKDFSLLCKELGLYGKELIAVDGTKFKANNSKRNNYNQKKIDRQVKYIDEKTQEYLKALENNDSTEENQVKYSSEEIKEKLEYLKQRKKTYEAIEQELKESGETEISTVDPDSRLMENKKNGLEMGYNLQIAVDEKHKLIVDFDVTQNASDQGNLNAMSQKAKKAFNMEDKDELELLADKGFYQAEDLKKCEENNTITYVSKQTYANSTNDREFYTDKFKYDKDKDIYLCPGGYELNKINHKKEDRKSTKYRNYEACKNCEYKTRCTTAVKGRIITRSKDQDFLDKVDARTQENMDKYLQRQMIVEHPFGTIKRTMNAGYYLCRGMESVLGETSLIMLAYNFKRVLNIVGIDNLRRKIAELRPSFSQILTNYLISA